MGTTFNPQILVEKLTKLNNSQQSIETLSHWCIFHMNKAKLVVETWERQFHCSPRDQRLPFLYLANDILQNSRRKGAEFVAEFWRVLPEALREVIKNGDDADKNTARRLISIWDERKVFGSHGRILKEEFVSRQSENSNTSSRQPNLKPKQSAGNVLDKIVSDAEILYASELDEENLLSTMAKLTKASENGVNSGKVDETGSTNDMQGQSASVKVCMEQLASLESSRARLVSHLRDALREEELKLEQIRSHLQAAQTQSDKVTNFLQQFTSSDNTMKERSSSLPPGNTLGEREAPQVVQASLSDINPASIDDDSRKSAAAAVAAKLTASSSSAEMLSLAFTSLVSGAAFPGRAQEFTGDHQSEKRVKLENDSPSYVSSPPSNNNTPINQQVTAGEKQPPSSSSPLPMPLFPSIMPPYPMPPQLIQTVGSMSNVAYTYGVTPQLPLPLYGQGYMPEGFPMTGISPYGPPGNPSQPCQVSEGGLYSPSSTVPMSSPSHQQQSS